MRRLVAFGDSYVEGYRSKPHVNICENNFVNLLGKELGLEVVNKGYRGNGNSIIANDVFRYVMNEPSSVEKRRFLQDCIFLVVWSAPVRGFMMGTEDWGRWGDFERDQYLVGIKDHVYKENRYLRETIANPVVNRMQYEQAVHSVRMLCYDYKIPLVMTNSVDSSFLTNNVSWANRERHLPHYNGGISEYWIEKDKPNNTLMDIIMNRWLSDLSHMAYHTKHLYAKRELPNNKELMTGCLHPTDKGHEVIAEKLLPYLKKVLEK